MKCGVFYHDHCFDGACSASVFTRFHRECIGTVQEFSYIGLMHRAGALFDESAFVDGENAIGMVTSVFAMRQAMAKARELLELVDLPADAIARYPHQFSGGQRQRIAIARALALDPDVLVADEAVSALDVSVQAQVLELLDEIQTRLGIALLFITHDLRVAAQICDDVAVMQNGRIVEQGPAARVLTNPHVAYTRALLDAAPGREWDFANFRPVAVAHAATP